MKKYRMGRNKGMEEGGIWEYTGGREQVEGGEMEGEIRKKRKEQKKGKGCTCKKEKDGRKEKKEKEEWRKEKD